MGHGATSWVKGALCSLISSNTDFQGELEEYLLSVSQCRHQLGSDSEMVASWPLLYPPPRSTERFTQPPLGPNPAGIYTLLGQGHSVDQ